MPDFQFRSWRENGNGSENTELSSNFEHISCPPSQEIDSKFIVYYCILLLGEKMVYVNAHQSGESC